MRSKLRDFYIDLAARTGLHFSEENEALWGELQGYPVVFFMVNTNRRNAHRAVFAGRLPNGTWDKEEAKAFRKSEKGIVSLGATATSVWVDLRMSNAMDAATILNAVVTRLQLKGFKRGCQHCGKDVPTVGANVEGAYMSLCDECFDMLRGQIEVALGQHQARRESVVAGTVGALLGSLVGVIAIVLIGRLGFVAAVSGLVMAVGTLFGYEKLGGKLSKKGVVICSVIMLLMTYLADQIEWAIVIMDEFDVSFFEGLVGISYLREMGAIEGSVYWGNLALLYVFVIVGAVPLMINKLANESIKNRIVRLDQTNSTAA